MAVRRWLQTRWRGCSWPTGRCRGRSCRGSRGASGGNPYFAFELREPRRRSRRACARWCADRLAALSPERPRGGVAGRGAVRGRRRRWWTPAAAPGRARDRWLARAVRASAALVVAYEQVADKRALHARAAALVDDPEERARHLALAADAPDEDVASALGRRGAAGAGARRARRRRGAARAGAAAHARAVVATWRRGRRAPPRGG